jgi:kumamolisin
MRGEVPPLSRAEAAQVLGAEPAELAKVEEFAKSHGLTITSSSPATRMVQVSGTVAQMEAAFGTKIHTCETGGRPYHCYQGALSIPEDLHGIVEGVLGLDQRPVARHLS